MQIKPLRRADTTLSDVTDLGNITYNDKYVVVYDFSDVGLFLGIPNWYILLTTTRPCDRDHGIHNTAQGP